MTKHFFLTALLLSACATTPPPDPDGTWQIVAVCPAQSPLGAVTINAVAQVAEVRPNEFVGELKNDRGQRGRITAKLAGGMLASELNWGGNAFSEANLKQQGDTDVFVGTDTYKCEITAQK